MLGEGRLEDFAELEVPDAKEVVAAPVESEGVMHVLNQSSSDNDPVPTLCAEVLREEAGCQDVAVQQATIDAARHLQANSDEAPKWSHEGSLPSSSFSHCCSDHGRSCVPMLSL